jgi:hypothetical protein
LIDARFDGTPSQSVGGASSGRSEPGRQTPGSSFYQRGTVYLDWNGSRYSDGMFFNQASVRVKFDLIDPPGQGWTLALDARDRVGIRDEATNQVILYSARLTFDKPGSRFVLSIGQMNLYDTAGIGALLGGMAGFKLSRDVFVGAFGGSNRPRISPASTRSTSKRGLRPLARLAGPDDRPDFQQRLVRRSVERRFGYANVFFRPQGLRPTATRRSSSGATSAERTACHGCSGMSDRPRPLG